MEFIMGKRVKHLGVLFTPTTNAMVCQANQEKAGAPTTTAQAMGLMELWQAQSAGINPTSEENEQIKLSIAEGPVRSSSYQIDDKFFHNGDIHSSD
ncbi:hypothetical protein P3T76_008747 [Phytophthora citrophthora]|uniref:Uncharacterized protein n=1 Tax=Phytophthora citrophthora TaxID=4793 RepID=A0AAD9GJF2_9STRA|nr:hypothetical protein P3T76_008747 [Phytophthora citrophthora]